MLHSPAAERIAEAQHDGASALGRQGPIEVSAEAGSNPRRPGVVAHRRSLREQDITRVDGIAVTRLELTLVDLATILRGDPLEAAVNEADKLGLIDPEALRVALEQLRGRRGVGVLRGLLDRRTFALTDSQLERRFLPIARRAGLPPPETGRWVNGYKVDFHWPGLGLVVETDGLRYHRTAAQQTRDRLRDQAHTAAGLTALRFAHAQVAFEPAHVVATLRAVARRLERAGRGRGGRTSSIE